MYVTKSCWKCLSPTCSKSQMNVHNHDERGNKSKSVLLVGGGGGDNVHAEFCSNCDVVQPPDYDVSPFDVLGAPRMFDLDMRQLEQRYQSLQRRLHPDYFHAKSAVEQEYSTLRSSQVNDAYRTLKSPTSRAAALLADRGVDMSESAGSFDSDPELLMEIMEKRETLERIEPGDERALRAMLEEETIECDRCFALFADAMDSDRVEQAKGIAVHMIYLEKIINMIRERLPVI
jgi:molecular chaperone HscB